MCNGIEDRNMLSAMSQIADAASSSGGARISDVIRGTPSQKESAPFSDLLSDAVGDMSRLEDEAQKAVEGLMTGSGIDVHQAMIATQKASMAFELSLAVRNKAVQAYQQLIGMQF
jgi:flagellar hook-basal body complex protein FliE